MEGLHFDKWDSFWRAEQSSWIDWYYRFVSPNNCSGKRHRWRSQWLWVKWVECPSYWFSSLPFKKKLNSRPRNHLFFFFLFQVCASRKLIRGWEPIRSHLGSLRRGHNIREGAELPLLWAAQLWPPDSLGSAALLTRNKWAPALGWQGMESVSHGGVPSSLQTPSGAGVNHSPSRFSTKCGGDSHAAH